MKITEIVKDTEHLEEGPLLNKIGTGIAKGVGTAAKAAGAVAGGIAGIGTAFKKGYAAGKGTVGAAGDDQPNTDTGTAKGQNTTSTTTATGNAAQTTTTTAKPAAQTKDTDAAQTTTTPTTPQQDKTKPETKPAPAAAAQDQKPAAAAQTKPAATYSAAPSTDYVQVEKAVDALGLEYQKQILSLLQSDPEVKKAMPKNRVTQKKKVAPTQAEIDADREAKMGPTSDSVIRKGQSIVEHIDEAGLMAKLGTKVGQAAQAVGQATGTAVKTAQDIKADPEHAKNLVKAFATGQTAKDPNSAPPIEDKSGTVPRPIIEKINQLTLEQRTELHTILMKKSV